MKKIQEKMKKVNLKIRWSNDSVEGVRRRYMWSGFSSQNGIGNPKLAKGVKFSENKNIVNGGYQHSEAEICSILLIICHIMVINRQLFLDNISQQWTVTIVETRQPTQIYITNRNHATSDNVAYLYISYVLICSIRFTEVLSS